LRFLSHCASPVRLLYRVSEGQRDFLDHPESKAMMDHQELLDHEESRDDEDQTEPRDQWEM